MDPELYELLVGQLLPGVLTVVGGVAGGYFARKGWKGWLAQKVLDEVIEEVVDYLNHSTVPQLKSHNAAERPEIGYDLNLGQSRSIMREAKDRVIEKTQERVAERGLPERIPPSIVLEGKIEDVVQRKKLERKESRLDVKPRTGAKPF